MEHPELWPKGEKGLSTKPLWDHLTSICGLQRPLSLEVFRTAIKDGVASGQFGYGVGDGEQFSFPEIWYSESVPDNQVDVQADCFLIRKEAAIESKKEKSPDNGPVGPEPSDDEEGEDTGIREDEGSAGKHVYKELSVEFDVSDIDWHDIRTYIFDELVKSGVNFRVSIALDVESDDGLDQGLVDNGIAETLEMSASNVKWKKKK